MKITQDEIDAVRYRKLRSIAVESGCLEAEIAMGQFDFMPTEERFDRAVDDLTPPPQKGRLHVRGGQSS